MSLTTAISRIQSVLIALELAQGVLGMNEGQGQQQGKRPIIEEIELQGNQLVDRVKELIQQGNIRKLSIKDSEGRYLLEIPLTVGVVAGSVLALTAPVWAALGALAALLVKVRVEIVRTEDGGDEGDMGGPGAI